MHIFLISGWYERSYLVNLYALLCIAVTCVSPLSASDEAYDRSKAQAIGIDFSSTYIHVSSYNNFNGTATHITSITPSFPYHNFMWEISKRHESQSNGHVAAWQAFTKTAPYRNMVLKVKGALEVYRLTSWLAPCLPKVLKDDEFRYKFTNDLDRPLQSRDDKTWMGFVLDYVPASFRSKASHVSAPECAQSVQLSNLNFINLLTENLEQVKMAATAAHNINITSAVISKPRYINNDLDRLVEQAFVNANIQLLSQMIRSEAAISLARQNGSTDPLVIEQSVSGLDIYRPSMSVSDGQLGAAFVPHLLLSNLLVGKHFNGSVEELTGATYRLRSQIVKERALYWCKHEPEVMKDMSRFQVNHSDNPGFQVIVENFGEDGYLFNENVSSMDLQAAEDAYKSAVEDAVDRFVLQRHLVVEYLKRETLNGEEFDQQDYESQDKQILDTARDVSIPDNASWWDPVDSVLVLADSPDDLLILEGALKALRKVPGFLRIGEYPAEYLRHDLAAQGAALGAANYVDWEDFEYEDEIMHEEL